MLWRAVSISILHLKLACRPRGNVDPLCAKVNLNLGQQLEEKNLAVSLQILRRM